MRQFKTQSLTLVKLCPQTNKLQLTNQAKQYLQSLKNPVAVITIAGLYRTGKSFLVNKLIPAYQQSQSLSPQHYNNNNSNSHQAFTVGSSTKSQTKGLSILATPITLQCQKSHKLIDYLLIDSEGIGSCQQSLKFDMNLLILIFLISSTVVYNTMGAIDQNSLEQLQAVLKLKNCVENKEVQLQCGDFKYKCQSQAVKLVWVLRDFSLQLVDKNGKQITPDQYLRQCLEQSSSTSLQSRKKNQIRKAIKQNLRCHNCITLVRPTIKQQQLQHLSTYKNFQQKQTKLRTQFLGQVQNLREMLFSGSTDDIKRVNGEQLSGKLFARIVQEYLEVINQDQLPRVSDIWEQVSKQSDQQYFDQQISLLKRQISLIKLPISKQQLKLRLNQLQTRISRNISSNIVNKSLISQFQSQYLSIVQKLNSTLKTKNTQLRTSTLLTQLHLYVKQNIKYQEFKAGNIGEIVNGFIQRVKLKGTGKCQEGSNMDILEYFYSVISDIVFIVAQKWGKVQREFGEIKEIFDKINMDKSNTQLSLMNLKRQYHQSLKSIAKLQQSQADIDKNYVLTQSKIVSYQNKIGKLQLQNKHDKQVYERNVKEIQEKYKSKIQDMTVQLKRVKDLNVQMQQQLASTRQKLSQFDIKSKKQVIFQQKIRQSFDKFHTQRTALNKQIDAYKKQLANINEKYTQMKCQYQAQCQKQKQIEESHIKREQNFMKQFQILKQTIKQTKASRDKTYETYISTQQKLSMCVPLSTAKKQKFMTPGKQIKKDEIKIQAQQPATQQQQQIQQYASDQENNKVIKKYYECQMQKLEQEHKIQIKRLEETIQKLQKQLQRKQTDKSIYFMQAKQYKQKCFRLEQDILTSNSKFNDFLKDLEQSKQKQRMLYEQSIVRLLNNIEKRDRQGDRDKIRESRESKQSRENRESRDKIYSQGVREKQRDRERDSQISMIDRNSLSSVEINTNIHRRTTRGTNNEENVSNGHSFGNGYFKTK